ncbi:MAG: SNF2-related protein, partial [Spirochaetales bacterium]
MQPAPGFMGAKVWHDFFVTYSPRTLLRNTKIDRRARRLFESGAVEIYVCSDKELSATVFGNGGAYDVTLLRDGGKLRAGCTCPSYIQPCKHIGALAYAGLEELGDKVDVTPREARDPDVAAGLTLDDGKVRPGVELARNTVDGEALHSHGEREGGAFIDSLTRLDPLPDGGIVVDSQGSLHYTGSGPSRSERGKRYRPVFELLFTTPTDPFGSRFRSRVYLRAALIYIRQDGSDGALGAYGRGKPRLQAAGSTERLYRYLTQQSGQLAPAVDALVGELGLNSNRFTRRPGEPTAREELELYFEREPGSDPRRAHPTAIEGLDLRWCVTGLDGEQPRLSLRFAVQSESEVLLPEHTADLVDSEGGLLLIPVEERGMLFYLAADRPVVYALRRLIAEAPSFSISEAREFARMCRTRLGDWVSVAEPPSQLTVLTVVPQPVVEIRSVPYEGTLAQLRFRYGDAANGSEIDITAPATLIDPLDGSWNVLRRVRSIERLYLARSQDVFNQVLEPEERSAPETHLVFGITLYRAAYDLLRATAETLLDAGFEVRYHEKPVRVLGASPSYRVVESKEGWFDAELGVHTDEGFVPLENPSHRGAGPKAGATVYVFSRSADLERYFDRGTKLSFPADDIASAALIEEFAEDPQHAAFERLRTLRQRLANFENVEDMEAPEGLECTLRPYQRHGLSWLWFLHEYGLGGCLADDMGLGKTIQTLACLLTARRRERMRRALVVAPVTTLSNWSHEIERFTPEFSACIHAGAGRAKQSEKLIGYDTVIVSYATLRMDIDLFLALPFDYLVLDEAQTVKNPSSKTRSALRRLDIPHRLALSGTPIENNT